MSKNKPQDMREHASEAFDVNGEAAAANSPKGGGAAASAASDKAAEGVHSSDNEAQNLSPEEELLVALKQERDRALRAQAEFENTKRRLQQQQAQALLRASERVITALIPAIDDLEFAIAHAEESNNEMLDGLKAIHSKLTATLAAEQVDVIDPVDEPFDHNTAQAVQMLEDINKPDQTVAQVLQKGYVMGANSDTPRVLRPAMVVVSTNPGAHAQN